MSDGAVVPSDYVFDLRFPWDERECVRAERAVARYREGYRALQWIVGGASMALILVSVASVVADGFSGWALLETLPYLAGCVIFPWLLWRGFPRLLAEKNRKPARWSPGQRFAVSEDDLVVELPGDAALVPWRAVGRVIETDEFLFFVHREGLPVYVPKRAFRDAAQLEALRAFVGSHVPPSAQLDWPAGPPRLTDADPSGGARGAARD